MVTIRHPEFRPDSDLSREAMEALQREIAATARFADDLSVDPSELTDALVAGVDQAFTGTQAVSAIVVMRDGEVVERVTASTQLTQPYIPGLLAFREGGSILAAFESLSVVPDLVLFDGSGRIHYREAGLATHIGVMLDAPSIGVAKRLLCGRPRHALDEPLPVGARVAIEADDAVTVSNGTVIGYAVQTRQFDSPNRHVNPLYVSPGHRISAETAADCVEAVCTEYKLPDPIRAADRLAGETATIVE